MTGFENGNDFKKTGMENCAEDNHLNIFNTDELIKKSRKICEELNSLGAKCYQPVYDILWTMMDIITAQTNQIKEYSDTIDSLERDNGELTLELDKTKKQPPASIKYEEVFKNPYLIHFNPEVPNLIFTQQETVTGKEYIINEISGKDALDIFEQLRHG